MIKTKRYIRISTCIVLVLLLMCCGSISLMAGSADNTYYNMGALSTSELNATYLLTKGTVIIMYPNSQNVVTGSDAEDLVINNEVDTVVIAGVGSSSQGTAAFAKHVAITLNKPVAGIVSGYGDGSIYTEGTQGYFIGRASNIAGVYYTEPASAKLASLYEQGAKPKKLIGHSKGNMDVANALFKLYNEDKEDLYSGVKVITFGCGVYVPSGVGSLKQYLGSLDTLGITNTVSYSNLTWVYGRYHTTNPYYSYTYMPIENYVI